MADLEYRPPAAGALAERPSQQLLKAELPSLPGPTARRARNLAIGGGFLGLMIAVTILLFSVGVVPTISQYVGGGLGLLFVILEQRRVDRCHRLYDSAREDMRAGQVFEAAAVIDSALAGASGGVRVAPVFVRLAAVRGVAALRLGEVLEARARLRAIDESGWLGTYKISRQLNAEAYASLSICASLLGDVHEARSWLGFGRYTLDTSHAHGLTAHKDDAIDSSSLSVELAEATLLAREGEHQKLFALLQRLRRDDDDKDLLGRALRLLQGYTLHSLAQAEDDYRGVFSGMPIAPLLTPLRRGELDFMAKHWPQLREFMQAHRLLAG